MIVVDSSVWITAFSKHPPFRIEELVGRDEVVTCLPIVQEVLQGIDDDYIFEDIRDLLYDLRAIDDPRRANFSTRRSCFSVMRVRKA